MQLSSIFVSRPGYAHATYEQNEITVKFDFTEEEAAEIIAISDRAAKRHREKASKTIETLGVPTINQIAAE